MPATLTEIMNSHRTGRPIVAGILNVTPDSFSDGGKFIRPADAVAQAQAMVQLGADIIDVGAESTRPGSERVSPNEQIARLRDVLPAMPGLGAIVSIDTTSADVARFALDVGASIINDVSAGRDDPDMLPLAAGRNCPIILMHMPAQPKTMQDNPQYTDVLAEVCDYFTERLSAASRVGVSPANCILDPGIGFGKRLEHNLALLGGIDRIVAMGFPVMVGASRKRFIGELTGRTDPAAKTFGTVAACLATWYKGATIFRVHDVGELTAALSVAKAIRRTAEGKKQSSRRK